MKRVSEKQITKDDQSEGSEGEEARSRQEGFVRASAEVMRTRRVVKARRSSPATAVDVPAAGLFSGTFAGLKGTTPASAQGVSARVPPAEKPAEAPPVCKSESLASTPAKEASADATSPKVENEESARPTPVSLDGARENSATAADGETGVVEQTEKSTAASPATKHGATESCVDNEGGPDAKRAGPVRAGSTSNRGIIDEGLTAQGGDGKITRAPEIPGDTARAGLAAPEHSNVGTTDKSPASDVTTGAASGTKPDEKVGTSDVPVSTGKKDGPCVVAGGRASEDTPRANAPPVERKTTSGTENVTKERTAPFAFGGIGASTSGTTFEDAAKEGNGESGFVVPAAAPHAALPAIPFDKTLSNNGNSAASRKYSEKEVITGEEQEEEVFRTRSRLYTLESGSLWVERGCGVLKIKKHLTTGKYRLLMRAEATLRLILNTPMSKALKPDRASERSVRFQGFGEDEKFHIYLARVATRDDLNQFLETLSSVK